MTHAVVFTGGDPVDPSRLTLVGPPDVVVAADSGADLAVDFGIDVDVLVGDMDSLSDRHAPQLANARVQAHDPDKDQTDLELALSTALEEGATSVTVVGGGGGRLDHLLGNVAAVCAVTDVPVTWITDESLGYPIHSGRQIDVPVGSTVGVIPVGGDAVGVTLEGLQWPLTDATLRWQEARGVSNVATKPTIAVSIASGVVLVVISA